MADSPAFDCVCDALEETTRLDRLEARGTVRLALKQAGLEPRSVTAAQMRVVLTKVLPAELSARGIDAPESVCQALTSRVGRLDDGALPESAEAVFQRLGG